MTAHSAATATRRRHIVCFGNPLHGDDGLGSAVFERLSVRPLPSDVWVTDAGTAGASAIGLFDGYEQIIVVDASRPTGRPGRVWRPSREEILTETSPSGHGVGVGHLLRCLEVTLEPLPEISFVAVEAGSVTSFQMGLSPVVARAVEIVVDLLHREFGEVDHA